MPTTAEYPSLRRYVLALGLSGPFDANEPIALPLGSGLDASKPPAALFG